MPLLHSVKSIIDMKQLVDKLLFSKNIIDA